MENGENTLVQKAQDILNQVRKAVVGKDDVLLWALATILAGGHILLEDIPGVGKTTMALAFSKALGLRCNRIQFTPDLLPSDLTGINFYNPKLGEFEFRPGPLFSNIILADEINRATPRTQSSLLEAMEERQITVDGTTSKLEEPFMVMATQNPLESYGTFPLPDAQIDRFFMRLSLGYMTRQQEMSVISRASTIDIVESLTQAVTDEDTQYVRSAYTQVKVNDDMLGYIMDIVEATRKGGRFRAGVSTRGAMALYKAAQVTAALSGRDYVIPEDVKFVAPFVLGHRVNADSPLALSQLLDQIPVPLESL